MGPRQVAQGAGLYEFAIEVSVPDDHPQYRCDRLPALSEFRPVLEPPHDSHDRQSNDPEFMIQMLWLAYG